jgi:hypothetical protein
MQQARYHWPGKIDSLYKPYRTYAQVLSLELICEATEDMNLSWLSSGINEIRFLNEQIFKKSTSVACPSWTPLLFN